MQRYGTTVFKILTGNKMIILLNNLCTVNASQEFELCETLEEEVKVKVVDPSMTKCLFTPSLNALVQRSPITMPSFCNIVESTSYPFCT